jgi:hypothetical protein
MSFGANADGNTLPMDLKSFPSLLSRHLLRSECCRHYFPCR